MLEWPPTPTPVPWMRRTWKRESIILSRYFVQFGTHTVVLWKGSGLWSWPLRECGLQLWRVWVWKSSPTGSWSEATQLIPLPKPLVFFRTCHFFPVNWEETCHMRLFRELHEFVGFPAQSCNAIAAAIHCSFPSLLLLNFAAVNVEVNHLVRCALVFSVIFFF